MISYRDSSHFSGNKESGRVRGGDTVQGNLQALRLAQQDGSAPEKEEEEEATAATLPHSTNADDHNHDHEEANNQSAEADAAQIEA